MKLISLLLLAAAFHVSARTHAQETITYTGKNIAMEKIFSVIREQTGYKFFYDEADVKNGHPVTVELVKVNLETALEKIFLDQPLQYRVEGKTIFISKKAIQRSDTIPPRIDVRGRVVDENGQPVIASVTVKKSDIGTTSDAEGFFVLQGLDDNATLVISGVNIETREFRLRKNTELTISVKTKINPLDQVQIIAYGTTTQRFNTGNMVSVKSEDIEKQPVNNPLLALIGRVPGAYISQTTGVYGGGININIRGQNSIANGIEPLYVVDGVPYTAELLPNLGTTILQRTNQRGTGNGNPFSYINSSDIESISILKDAEATSIYGSRGANGVVLITTKKGIAGQSKVDINLNAGYGYVPTKSHLLNTEQYLAMRREAFQNDGVSPTNSNAPDLMLWDSTAYTDWQEVLIGGRAKRLNTQVSISGGSTAVQYLVGGTFNRETTVFPGNFSNQKIAFHSSLNTQSNREKLKMSLSANYLVDNSTLPTNELTQTALTLAPNAPKVYNSDGTLNWENSTWTNPLYITRTNYRIRTNNLISNATLSYKILSGISANLNAGFTNMQVGETATFPIAAQNPAFSPTGSASFTNNFIESWIVEPQLKFSRDINRFGVIEAVFGSTFQESKAKGTIVDAAEYTSDALIENIEAAGSRSIRPVVNTTYKYNALFGRINYRLHKAYIFNVSARRDGSSRFGQKNRFSNFAGISGGWIITEENFLKDKLNVLNFGKLRVSYGTTGNDQIGDYTYYDLYDLTTYPYQGIAGLTPGTFTNPYLQWENTKKLEFGLEFSLFKGRIFASSSYYSNRSSNQLVSYPLPSFTGFGAVASNFPAIVGNTGWEFIMNTTNIKTNNFSWSSSFNLTIPRNKLLAFPGLENTTYASRLIIGEPITINRVYHLAGINDTTGIYEFFDSKGMRIYDPASEAQTRWVDLTPKFYGGFTNSINYKNINLDFSFQFTKQTGKNVIFAYPFSTGRRTSAYLGTDALDRWQSTGDKPTIQKFSQSLASLGRPAYLYAQQSDYAYVDASFIRLKNISLSYRLPDRLSRKLKITGLQIYAQGQNIATITDYKGLDPENNNGTVLPALRVITLGFRTSL